MKIYPDPNDQSGEGRRPPPPPPPPVTIRTMESDVKSVEGSGGGGPQGETFNAPRPPIRPEAPNLPTEEGVKLKVPGYAGPEKPVFPSGSFPAEPPKKIDAGGNKLTSIVVYAVIVLVATLVGFGLYFYVYPLFLGNGAPAPAENGVPPPAPQPQPPAHTSLISADSSEEATAPGTAVAEIVGPGGSVVKEVLLRDAGGNATPLSSYLPGLIPELTAGELSANFKEDFTAFIYYDEQGAWSGYVFEHKANVAGVVAENVFRKIESSASLSDLFLANPGTQQGDWKSGKYRETNTRYLVFENGAVNYARVGSRVILATYFPALQEIIDNRLQ